VGLDHGADRDKLTGARGVGQEGLRLLAKAGKEDHRARDPAQLEATKENQAQRRHDPESIPPNLG
jgi:hypothetical protein